MNRARTAILYMALFHVGMGFALLTGPPSADVPDQAILYTLMPLPVRAALWVGFGVMAALVSLRAVRWGWVLLSMMPAQRLVGHAFSTYAWFDPGGATGMANAWAEALSWAAVLLLIRHLAGWPDLTVSTAEPPRR